MSPFAPPLPPDPVGRSLHVELSDGVRLAVDVWLPAGLPDGERIGTVLRATRYHRADESDGVTAEARRWTGWGYALVLVDARGSGASFGSRDAELSRREIEDYGEVLDWIARQPWSNGRAGAYGHSYDADTAELMASLGNPVLRAVAPLFPDYDVYEDLMVPGGVPNRLMTDSWLHMTRALDGIDGALEEVAALGETIATEIAPVKPVDGPDGPALREAAIREHQANADLRAAIARTPFKDDVDGGWSWAAASPQTYREATERAGVPTMPVASWFDAGTAAGTLTRFAVLDVPQEAYVGAWSHGAKYTCDAFRAEDERSEFEEAEVYRRVRDFFDRYVQRGEEPRPGRRLHYLTLASGEWATTETWPPRGTATTRWYLGAEGALTQEPPAQEVAVDVYRPDPSATAGASSRWGTQVSGGGAVVYPDRAAQDARLLAYTSAPLERDAHVAGTVAIVLELSSSQPDGTLFAYLEDVAPNGRVTYLTEGQLLLSQRARSFARADARPLQPGTVETVRIELFPVSAVVRAGHRLRIALASNDASHFETVPADGEVTYEVHRERDRPSWVEVPVAP
ncbi:CocE/NonD family hydrolase [Conexibacter woesei]|uniref:X-Pro dipeptidyl-peptidase domain protein n=1 Tax=Conexibacter woesei (strain DSM 14684 / CCUG 47730 / CIP 108061 / JCM 11494 / NBRC 100937 / ID131577) TaxID=469383 RepID=D3FF48_CONWI|nr:CocE/NonD family hydrolase [Conexibacter woesei]ADB51765.1 X-Pro dipeptidyl-peptidase domain protein [Conexibacter woesei DSM 14684]